MKAGFLASLLGLAAAHATGAGDVAIEIVPRHFAMPDLLPLPAHVRLEGDRGAAPEPAFDRARGIYRFPSVGPGKHRLVIDDPRYQDVAIAGIAAGSSRVVQLCGAAAVRLRMVDSSGGAVDGPLSVSVMPERVSVARNSSERTSARLPYWFRVESAPPDADGFRRIGCLIPGDLTLALAVPGYANARVRVGGLAAGETRTLEVQLAPRGGIRGRVVAHPSDGALGSVSVRLLTRSGRALRHESRQRLFTVRSTAAGGDGSFDFSGIVAGRYVLRAAVDGVDAVESRPVEVADGRWPVEVELELPRLAWIDGRIEAPPNDLLPLCSLAARHVFRSELGPEPPADSFAGSATAAIAADGSFRIGPLPAGPARFWLCLPHSLGPGAARPTTSASSGASQWLGTPALAFDGAAARVAFDLRERFPRYDERLGWQTRPRFDLQPLLSSILFPRLELGPAAAVATARDSVRRIPILCLDERTGEPLRRAPVSWASTSEHGLPQFIASATDDDGLLFVPAQTGTLWVRRGAGGARLESSNELPSPLRLLIEAALGRPWPYRAALVEVRSGALDPAEVRLFGPPLQADDDR